MSASSRAGMIGTVSVHVALIGGALWSARANLTPPMQVYAIDLVAAPMPEEAVTKPTTAAPEPSRTAEEAPILKPKKAPPRVEPKKPTEAPVKNDPPKVTQPPEKPLPGETPKNGVAVVNVSIAGFASKYQWYLDNLYQQIAKRFVSPPPGSWVAEVRFTVKADGSVTDMDFVTESRSSAFNTKAMSAIEGAGAAGDFGKLPPGVDRLTISFAFRPPQND